MTDEKKESTTVEENTQLMRHVEAIRSMRYRNALEAVQAYFNKSAGPGATWFEMERTIKLVNDVLADTTRAEHKHVTQESAMNPGHLIHPCCGEDARTATQVEGFYNDLRTQARLESTNIGNIRSKPPFTFGDLFQVREQGFIDGGGWAFSQSRPDSSANLVKQMWEADQKVYREQERQLKEARKLLKRIWNEGVCAGDLKAELELALHDGPWKAQHDDEAGRPAMRCKEHGYWDPKLGKECPMCVARSGDKGEK